jgi:tight adherence protein C
MAPATKLQWRRGLLEGAQMKISLAEFGGYLDIGIAVLIAITGTYLFSLLFFTPADPVAEGAALEAGGRRREFKHWFLRIFGGLIVQLGGLISALPLGESRERLRKKLIQSGSPGGLSVDEFHAARIVAIVLLFLCGSYMDIELDTSPLCGIGLGALGLVYPDIWLGGEIQKRRRRIFRDLPDMLDLLRLSVDAGMDLSSAMKIVVERGRKGPMLDELEKVEREMSLGRTRKESLRNFADRLMMPEINSFVLALIQADALGASIGPILKVQGEMARTRRWQQAEVLVNKMPMKMLGPLVLFIFPASFIVLFTPLIIQWMQSE